ncbi:Tfp pilus assembly protein PilF [Alteromonadaceae bacterium Bs31]|nr:Tfp pilus assembly protein PilF [Alteromonadaceae bacterium Bs31]
MTTNLKPSCLAKLALLDLVPLLVLCLITLSPLSHSAWVGSGACKSCHEQQYEDWSGSDHFKAMAEASPETVLGDFSNKTLTFHNIDHRFFIKEGKYYVETIGNGGKKEVFHIPYTFGWFPLQQYLADIGDGHLQAMNVSWDSRSKEDGGQRWFHLQPDEDINASNPFFWGAHVQNWNSRCAECHSTNLQRNYKASDHSYNTTWSEINVACEACHGQGDKHIDLVNSKTFSNTNTGLSYASDAEDKGANHINMCGGCHSRRYGVDDPNKFADYHDKYRLQTLINGLYHSDGQILDEVYVLGSFMQSKMHAAGVTCTNCHNPHSGKLIAEPQAVCAQCHDAKTYDKASHHLHPQKENVLCVDCHMPEKTYMVVDPRRDHSFVIPNPQASIDYDVPNACMDCHEEKGNEWAVEALAKSGIKPEAESWLKPIEQARNFDVLSVRALSNIVYDETIPPLIRATAIESIGAFPSRVSLEAASHALQSKDPLVRRSAIAAISFAEPDMRWTLLQPLLTDEVRFVRNEAAMTLADIYYQLSPVQRKPLEKAISETMQSLQQDADRPSAQLNLAFLHTQMGAYDKAEKAYLHALKIYPVYVPALLNYAEFLRNAGKGSKELPLYEKAMSVMPDSASVNHAMGLYYIRNQNYQKALPLLAASAGDLLDASPRFAYVYAVALFDLGHKDKAVNELIKSNKRWINRYDTLALLIHYLEQTGRSKEVYPYLSQLSFIAPGSPQVKEWINKYR